MKPIPIPCDQLQHRFGNTFTSALLDATQQDPGVADVVEAWNVSEAKNHFSQVPTRLRLRPTGVLAGIPALRAGCGSEDPRTDRDPVAKLDSTVKTPPVQGV